MPVLQSTAPWSKKYLSLVHKIQSKEDVGRQLGLCGTITELISVDLLLI